MNGTSDTCTKNTFARPSSWRICRADSMNGCDSMSPTVPPISVMMTSGCGVSVRLQAHPPLDLVGDVRDDLHRVAEVLAAALARDDLRVDLAGGDVRRLAEVDVEEALVVPDVEVGLGAVVGHEDLAVLERVHRSRVDVEVGVELLHHDAQPACGEQVAQARGGQSLAQRGNDTACHEDVPGGAVRRGAVRNTCRMSFRHGLLSYQSDWARRPSSSRAWVSAASESGIPESSARHLGLAIGAVEAADIGCRDRAVARLHDRAGGCSRTRRPGRGGSRR